MSRRYREQLSPKKQIAPPKAGPEISEESLAHAGITMIAEAVRSQAISMYYARLWRRFESSRPSQLIRALGIYPW